MCDGNVLYFIHFFLALLPTKDFRQMIGCDFSVSLFFCVHLCLVTKISNEYRYELKSQKVFVGLSSTLGQVLKLT